ncbi:MAG TPA: hypothetical protein VKB86_20020, partial [Pyrinomonadaceae bacterium]|nr:hypothetical protein [Pyrinomonadaceae bacterium]
IDAQIKAGTLPYKVVVDNFDYAIIYPGGNNEKLKLIKTLLDAKKLVVIMSSCEPADCSFGKATNGKAATGEENGFKTQHNGLDGQWVEIISHFKKVYYFEKDDAELERAIAEVEISFNAKSDLSKRSRNRFKQLLQLVRQESAPQEFLQEVCVKIIKQDGFENMEPDSVSAQILEQAQLYYQKIWDDCSEGEKLTLLHLAQDRFLSPNDIDIKPLLQRGLIKRDPDIRFMTESFKQFVQSQSLSGGLESIETLSRRTSPWEALRVPLLIIFVGVLLFLFLTQKNFYNSSLTLVTALTTSIPAFFKLLGLFQGDGSGSKA